MTTKEAAKRSGYSVDYVGRLCREGRLSGVFRMGDKIWLIPVKSIEEYKPGPRGRHAGEAKAREDAVALNAELNSAIRVARGRPISEQIDEPQSGQETTQAPIEYISVAEAADRIKMSQRAVRSWCKWGWIVGARKSDKKGKEWFIPVGSLEGALKHVRMHHSAKIKALQSAKCMSDAEKVGV